MISTKRIGQVIAFRRKELGYSQSQLATAARIDQSTLSHYEKGDMEMGIITFNKIWSLLGLTGCSLDDELEFYSTKTRL